MKTPAPTPQVPPEKPELATLQAALLRKLVEVLPVGVWLAGADGTIVLGNAAGQRVWAGARYVGIEQFGEYKGWWPDGRRIAAEDWALARAITHGETSIGQEIEIECFDGTRKFIRNSAAPVRDEAGTLLGAVVVNEDITALKGEQRTLREANERFERVARATTDAVWDWDLATDALWWNANFHLLFGYPPEQTKPTIESWSDFIHPADRDRVLGEVHAAIEGSAESWSGEYRFRRGDGSYADVFDRGYIQRDPAGRGLRMSGAMMDISARKAAERALAESEARFRSLSSLTSDWIWETDAEHRFIHTPPRLTEMIGYRAPHYVGKRRWEVAGLSPVEGDWSAHQRVLARRESFRDFELAQMKGDGSLTYLQVSGEPVYDEAGNFKGYRGTAKDVTPRKRTEQALRESEGRFRALVELSSDWYWEQDEELRFLATDHAKSGMRAKAFAGKTRWEVVGASLEDPAWAAHKAQLERREPFQDFEYDRVGADGVYRWVSISGEPVFDPAGRFLGYRGVGRDITARKRAEAEREKVSRMYAALSALNELVARARTPGELLHGACEIAVGSSELEFAVVRFVDASGTRARVVAHAGSGGDPSWVERDIDLSSCSPESRTLAASAIRTGRPVVAAGEALRGHPFFASLRQASSIQAIAAYPLLRGGACAGALILSSRDERAFEGEVGALMERMAANVSFGLEALDAEYSLRRFRLALDQSADLIALVDRETMRYVDANETLCRHLGYSREELLQMHPEQVLPFTRAELEASYDALIADPAHMLNVRSHYICRDGSQLPFEATRHAIRSGERWIVVGIARDIRERLASEEALRRKDAYFRSLVENLSDAIGATDMDWRYLYAGPSVEKILGFRPEELVGRRFADATAPEAAEALRRDLAERLERTGAPQTARFEARYKDGKLRVHEVVVSKGTGPEGQPIYVIAGRDVTEKVRAEETLRRFRLALDRSGEMIAIVDLETMRYVDANDSLCAALGYSRDELLAMHPDELIPVSRDELRATYERLTRGEDVPAVRSHYRRRDGSLLPYESRRHAVRSEGRWLIVSIARDIRAQLAAEEALRKREEEFRAVAENAPDGIMRFDAELRCRYANAALGKTSGHPAEWFLGRRIDEFELPGDLAAGLGEAVRRALGRNETQVFEFAFQGPRGERHYQARLAPERGPDGRPVSVLGISRDITDRKRIERAMAESEARLRSIVHASAEPLLLVDPDGTALFANPAAAALFGRPVAELEGAPLGLPLAAGRPADVDIVLPGGAVRPAEMQVGSSLLEGREVLVVSLHDLSERLEFESHIRHLATHDGLTGLPNRALLGDRIEQAIVHARRQQGSLALLFVDLDQFKLVNDSFGHGVGDALLVEVANRLRETVREGDTVARLGGDEFVILLTSLSRPGDSALVARKIAQALDRPVALGTGEVRVTASIGISLYPDDGDGLDALLQSADAAMYRAKDSGRNSFHYYSAEMGEQARSRVETEAGLRRALEHGELRLHYQPQVDLSSGNVTVLEALLRWEHPQRGMVSPAAFIPVAEESGLIVPIGQWVLRAACREAAGWAAAGLRGVKVAVNLSARQFWRGSVTDAVRTALAESGLQPSQLEVEITESVVARDLQQVMLALEQLRRMGVGIAIDDFGTGYSSLAYLRSLPINKVKVDKSFIHGIPADAEATALVGEIIRLAHVLSLGVVAEGVETSEQARFLRDAGCEAMQGFLFARPMPAADAAALLRSGRRFAHGG